MRTARDLGPGPPAFRADDAMQQRRDDDDDGFTLIELMVVIGIVGILIAIMIPTLLQARRPAQDRQAQNLLRNSLTAAKAIETSEGAVATAATLGARGDARSSTSASATNAPAGQRQVSVDTTDRRRRRLRRSSRRSPRRAAASPSSSRPSARRGSSASTAPRRVGPRSSTPRPAGRAPGRDRPGSPRSPCPAP